MKNNANDPTRATSDSGELRGTETHSDSGGAGSHANSHTGRNRVMALDPFDEQEDLLARTFYSPGDPDGGIAEELGGGGAKKKPTHYRVVSVSLYNDDIERIDSLVKELKRRGFTKMNRSALIRFAVDTVNIDDLPRQY